MIKKYQKGKKTKLSKNFHSKEFDCHCKFQNCQHTYVDEELIEKLQKKRKQWKQSVYINSGYRCQRWNEVVGGAPRSQHKKGRAADIAVKNLSPSRVAKDCEDFKGLGRYSSFTHVDTRPGRKARWDLRR